jgi:hypothetical protein
MVQLNAGNVIGDNLWLWRADHNTTGKVTGGANPVQNGLVVNGDDVTMYRSSSPSILFYCSFTVHIVND